MRGRRLYPLSIAIAGADQRVLTELAHARGMSRSALVRELVCEGIDRLCPEHVQRMERLGIRREVMP